MSTASEGLPNFLEYYLWYQKFGFERAAPFGNPAQWELFKTQFSPITQLLKKYGSGAHLYLPGTQYVQGFVPGNYFDSAGTTHASVDGSVGLVLDAAGSVGSECYPNGLAGASVTGGATISSGVGTLPSASSQILATGFTATAGVTYKVEVDVTNAQSGFNLNVYVGSGAAFGIAMGVSNGRKRMFIKATAASGAIFQNDVGATGSGQISNISVVPVTGIHATQPTPGYKPTLRKGIVNLLTYSNALTNAAWGKLSSPTITPNASTGPGGMGFAQRLLCNTNANVYRTLAVSVEVVSTVAVIFKQDTAPEFGIEFNAGITGALRYGFGVGIVTNSCLTNPTVIALQDGYYLLAGQVTSTTVNPNLFLYGNGYYTAPPGASLVYATGHFAGTLTAAQIIAAGGIPLTTTAPASSSAGNAYLEFDGVDDRLALSAPAFQFADDQLTVVSASISSIGIVANKVIYSPATENVAGIKRMAQISYDTTVQMISASWYDGTHYDNLLFAWPLNVPFVAVAWKVGNSLKLRVNGVERAAKAMTIAGFIADRGSIGSYDPHQSVNAFHGKLYFADAIKGTLTLAEVQLLEKQAAAAAGIQL